MKNKELLVWLGFAVFIWILCLGVGLRSGGFELSPEDARNVLDRYYALINGAETIRVVEAGGPQEPGFTRTFCLMKPNLYKSSSDRFEQYMYGYKSYLVKPEEKAYEVFVRTPGMPDRPGFEPFLQPQQPAYTLGTRVLRSKHRGKAVYEIETAGQTAILVDRQTLIPVAWKRTTGRRSEVHSYLKVELNLPMDKKQFLWTPPKGYRKGIN